MEVIVVTCDAFSHVVPLCVKYLYKTWPQGVTGKITVVTNSCKHELTVLKERGYVNRIHMLGPDEGWSNNMIKFLNESGALRKNRPFLLLLEDYIVYDINRDLVAECMNTINQLDEVGMIRLAPIPRPTHSWHDHRGRHKYIGKLDKTTHTSYCMSLQAAMWKPRTLLATLEPDQNPWKTEGRGSRRIARGEICLSTQFLCTYSSAIKYKNLLRRGVPHAETVEWLKRQGESFNAVPRSA